jgi:bifunctional UDP-N-acetylglucosamine pyrophosphorylase/glucosamine-1-phosphate N-acetyltransferase
MTANQGAPMPATAVILAAGMGTRMKSALPKALHPIAGRPMLRHLLDSCEAAFDRIVAVVGPDMEVVQALAKPHPCVVQAERLGTAHAALQAASLFGTGDVAVLYADNPLIRPATLRTLLARRAEGDVALVLLAMRPPDPGQYGRVVGGGGYVDRVAEWSDATEAERAGTLCNAGVLCAAADDMVRWLGAVRPHNAKGEYYLTDVVACARAESKRVAAVEAPFEELRGINARAELAEAEATVQSWLRAAALDNGVTMTDPSTVFLCADTVLEPDVSIGPHVVFGPGVHVASGTAILPFTHLAGCSIGPGCVVGPYARIRPGTDLGPGAHIGNFVELKAAQLGAGAKANHLSYLGDVSVGDEANIGAGTITCNYDGFAKHRTEIGARVFVGSDTALVAPVRLGDGAMTAAGSVVTSDVPADALVVARGRQVVKPGYAAAFRANRRKTR